MIRNGKTRIISLDQAVTDIENGNKNSIFVRICEKSILCWRKKTKSKVKQEPFNHTP